MPSAGPLPSPPSTPNRPGRSSLPSLPALPGLPALPRLPGLPARRSTPSGGRHSTEVHNYRMLRGDSIAMGVVNAVSPFMPVLIVRLGGSAFDVSLLTAIPAIGAVLLAIPVGQFLQGKRRIVPWYSGARMIAHLSYAIAAFVVLVAPAHLVVPALLAVWAIAAVPSTFGAVAFPIVMDGAAGPRGRYELMSRRWAIMGLTTAITVALIGQLLDRLAFPMSYQIAFVGFSVAGLVSYWFTLRFRVPDHPPPPLADPGRRFGRIAEMIATVRGQPAFLRYSARQLVFVVGSRFAVPLVPLYYVREVGATDAWIGIIATGQSLALLVGYYGWRKLAFARGRSMVLLLTLILGALYPAALSLADNLVVVAVLAAVAAIFAAGIDLSLFDELMKRIPRSHGVTFTSIDTTLVNAAGIVAPLLGAAMAVTAGIHTALQVASLIGLLAAVLFALDVRGRAARSEPAPPAPPGLPAPPAPAAPPTPTEGAPGD